MPLRFSSQPTFPLFVCLLISLLLDLPICPANSEASSDRRRSTPVSEDDLKLIQQRILDRLTTQVTIEEIRPLVRGLQSDGSWSDIDYQDVSRSQWKLATHLSRLTQLATAYRTGINPPTEQHRLKQATLASLDHWLEQDYRNPNWWWNVIGVPRSLGNVLLLLEDDLSSFQLEKGLAILERAKIGMTGQNLVWVAKATAIRGLLEQDAELVAAAYQRIAKEIQITDKEGVQPDYSFHQHGPCLYNHGYGASFAVDCSEIAALLVGTELEFSPEKTKILTRLVLDGSQWMSRGDASDFGAEGRETSRPGQDAQYLSRAATNLLQLPTGRETELHMVVARTTGRKAEPLVGNRHFWHSDIMTHHRPAYYASARMVSSRIANTDGPANSEGLKNHHISDGCNVILRTGQEYQDIFPVWDWQKIPGTTVAQKPKLTGSPRRMGETNFVGGVSDGQYGMAAMDLAVDKLSARKTWFFFDDQFVCLGAGIRCTENQHVLTTLNQCLMSGSVSVGNTAGQRQLKPGRHAIENVEWVWQDQIAYRFLQPTTAHIINDSQVGNWQRINGRLSKDPVTLPVFTLWIDHGVQPHGDSYAYVVTPGKGLRSDAESSAEPISLVANNPQQQGVWHRQLRIAQLAFFQAGTLTIHPGFTLSVDTPCLVMLRQQSDQWFVSMANPVNQAAQITATLSMSASSQKLEEGETSKRVEVVFDLPGGLQAGSTITRPAIF